MVLSCLNDERVQELRVAIRDTLTATLLIPNPHWRAEITDAKIDAAETILEIGTPAQVEIAVDVLAEGLNGSQNFCQVAKIRAARILARALIAAGVTLGVSK